MTFAVSLWHVCCYMHRYTTLIHIIALYFLLHRYKKTESDLRTIVSSFRVYPDVDLSKAIAANDAKFNTYEEN